MPQSRDPRSGRFIPRGFAVVEGHLQARDYRGAPLSARTTRLIVDAWREGKKADPTGAAALTGWRLARMDKEDFRKLYPEREPGPGRPPKRPPLAPIDRQRIIRTILDDWPDDPDDEDEYFRGLLRLMTRGGSPPHSIDLHMMRRVHPAAPEAGDFVFHFLP